MTVVSEFVAMRELTEQSVALRLLRAKHAPVILSIIESAFDERKRRIPVQEFEIVVETSLSELTQRLGVTMERTAHDYCEDWRKEGYLLRRPLPQSRQEAYEPSPDALTALAFMRRLREPQRVATESRLATIVDNISNLALAIDTNTDRRMASLIRERDALDEQIRDLEAGHAEPLDLDRAVERAKNIIALAQEIPLDFGRVRQDFEEINATLYETIVNVSAESEDVLDDVFLGVDRIATSPSGTSFRAFYQLLADVDRAETLEDETRAILEHPLANELTLAQRVFLRDLMRILLRRSEEVDEVMTSLARGLRRFVQNRNYQKDRLLKRSIDHSLSLAHQLVGSVGLRAGFSQPLDLSGVSMKPVSRHKLKNPLENRSAPVVENAEAEEPIPYERVRAIARQSEIDFVELAGNVNRCLEAREERLKQSGAQEEKGEEEQRRWISVGEVLETFPATQGIASVVGLMALALEQGELGEGDEEIRWTAQNGAGRRAKIKELRFYEEVMPV